MRARDYGSRFGLCLRAALLLHVYAAPKVRTLGNGDSRSDDVPIDRAIVSDIHLLACRDVPRHFSKHDHGLGEYLRFDAAVGTNRQHMVPKLNGPLDVPFDRQILAAVQLTLDDNRFADVHNVLLRMMACVNTRTSYGGW